jgi:hypothetical protein
MVRVPRENPIAKKSGDQGLVVFLFSWMRDTEAALQQFGGEAYSGYSRWPGESCDER